MSVKQIIKYIDEILQSNTEKYTYRTALRKIREMLVELGEKNNG